MANEKNTERNKQTKITRKRKLRHRAKSSVSQNIVYPFLCFDSETTNHGELLELAIYDPAGNEIFHEYFRPHATKWPEEIHHITPEKVASCKRFIAHRHNIQKILNSTNYFVGCALSNDLHSLKRYGVKLHGRHRVHDIQSWYWLLNDDSDRHTKLQTGLAAIADTYSLGFGEDAPHSATADTKLTLHCFEALVEDFYRRKNTETPEFERPFTNDFMKEMTSDFDKSYQEALQYYRMHNTAGYINVKKREQGYSFKYTRTLPSTQDLYLFSVPVNDRVGAEIDLRNHFYEKQIKGFTGIYDLDENDFNYIRNYRNEIDIEIFRARESKK